MSDQTVSTLSLALSNEVIELVDANGLARVTHCGAERERAHILMLTPDHATVRSRTRTRV